MKTVILGYADTAAKGKPALLAGTEVPITDQVKIITGIKASGEYPKGIRRVEFCEVISRTVAIRLEAPPAAKTPKS